MRINEIQWISNKGAWCIHLQILSPQIFLVKYHLVSNMYKLLHHFYMRITYCDASHCHRTLVNLTTSFYVVKIGFQLYQLCPYIYSNVNLLRGWKCHRLKINGHFIKKRRRYLYTPHRFLLKILFDPSAAQKSHLTLRRSKRLIVGGFFQKIF